MLFNFFLFFSNIFISDRTNIFGSEGIEAVEVFVLYFVPFLTVFNINFGLLDSIDEVVVYILRC